MNDLIAPLSIVFLSGMAWMLLARFNHYSEYPDKIHRHDDGQINWKWMLFINITAVVTGGAVSTVAFMVIKYVGVLPDELSVFFSSLFGIAADKLFILIQQKMHQKVEGYIDDEF